MLLVGQAELPTETDIAFDVTLADGSKPIRAEAKVVGPVGAGRGPPRRTQGALQALRRRDARLRRARGFSALVRGRRARGDARAASRPAELRASVPPPPASVRPPRACALQRACGLPRDAPSSTRPSSVPAWSEDKTQRFNRAVALSRPMVHPPSEECAPPSDRDVLLDRLRKRARAAEGSGT